MIARLELVCPLLASTWDARPAALLVEEKRAAG